MKRYMLHPGWVPSPTGAAEYVGTADLVRLYRIKRKDCCVCVPSTLKALSPAEFGQLIHLYPDRTGAYRVPRQDPPGGG